MHHKLSFYSSRSFVVLLSSALAYGAPQITELWIEQAQEAVPSISFSPESTPDVSALPLIELSVVPSAAPSPLAPEVSPSLSVPANVHAIWLSFPYWNLTSVQKRAFGEYLAKMKINKVYLSVYDSGIARWPSQILKDAGAADIQSDDLFLEGINAFRSQGIQVAAFFESGLAVRQDKPLVQLHPDWFQRCDGTIFSGEHGGKVFSFLDPLHEQVRGLIVAAAEELAKHSVEFSEIQLDRFRFTQSIRGRTCTSSNGLSSADSLTALVSRVYKKIKSIRSEIIVSASPVGSYGYWKFSQSWSDWVRLGVIDLIATQAYIEPFNLADCKKGSKLNMPRRQKRSVFKAEIATVVGRPDLLERAAYELKVYGGNVAWIDLPNRRALAQKRKLDLAPQAGKKQVPITIGYAVHRFDDSECIQDYMKVAHELGYKDTALWVSAVQPTLRGDPQPTIHDNLSLLLETLWKE